MPLLTLTIPKQLKPRMSELEGTANRILDEVIGVEEGEGMMGIPDKEDRELRIVLNDAIDKPEARLSFTIGESEYPDFENPAFYPIEETVLAAGKKIKQLVEEVGLSDAKVTMEAWENTTFKLREFNLEKVDKHGLSVTEVKTDGQRIKEPKICLTLSSEMIQTSGGREKEGGGGIEFFNKITGEMARVMKQTLGIPEKTKFGLEVVVADEADSDISIEFDCQPEGGLIPKKLRELGAGSLEQLLNEKLPSGEAEIWIRQGKPISTII